MKREFNVLLSKHLPIDTRDEDWAKLSNIANILVQKNSRSKLENNPKIKSTHGLVTMLSDRIDENFLKKAPKLKVIANYAVGFNNIDLAATSKRGIVVCNTPDVLTNATAELTIGLILAAARRFKEGTELIRTHKFKEWHPELLLGRELTHSRLGIIGYGRIGRAVAEKAQALGMHVSFCSRIPQYHSVPLEELLRTSDFVSLHCPLNPQTKNLIGKKELALMKPGAWLINTARGEVVDEEALIAALKKKNGLQGAALDVFCSEPKLKAALRAHPKVFVLPHLGSATLQARHAMAKLCLRALFEVFNGNSPQNRVN